MLTQEQLDELFSSDPLQGLPLTDAEMEAWFSQSLDDLNPYRDL